MRYGVILKIGGEDPEWYHGEVSEHEVPRRVIDMMACEFVDRELGLCRICQEQHHHCHVIEDGTGRKFCPVLFVDAVKPEWVVSELV